MLYIWSNRNVCQAWLFETRQTQKKKRKRCWDPLLEKCIDLVISWFFFSWFWASVFQNFWILGFKDSKFLLICVWKIFGPYYQISISCFLVDIGPISNIFKMLLNGSSGFRHPSFQKLQKWISGIVITIKIIFKSSSVFLDLFRCHGVSKDEKWFWGSGTRSKVPKS